VERRRVLKLGAVAATALAAGCSADSSKEAESFSGMPEPRASTSPPKKPTTGVLQDQTFTEHQPGEWHPESPRRLTAIEDALAAAKLEIVPIKSRPATENELTACHEKSYLETAQREIASGEVALSTGDTAVSEQSWRVAVLAAGGVLAAVDAVLAGEARNAFCAVRPPGHHAGPARGMGFCILNNVALAARYAQKRHGLGKVLIVDWDVHHGNGTQEIFDEDPTVLFFDTHQHPWYPGTGAADEIGKGKARGTKLNVPLPAGSGRKEILAAYQEKLLPAARKFRPEMVFLSAGFDSRQGDPLGRFTLEDNDFAEMTRLVKQIAAEYAEHRLVSVLEGGYALSGLASAVVAHVQTLAEA
jgi:acetoin utilization deacetylase AcuC-like enzyme